MTRRRRVVFVHSSNEMFGADRILIQVVDALLAHTALEPEVWLPADVVPADDNIADHLRSRGVEVRVLPLPILRRRYLNAAGLPGLAWRTIALPVRLWRRSPVAVYCTTSATLLAAPAARLAGARAVILHNQEIWAGREARVLGLLASACTAAVSISEASAASLRGGIRSRSITVANAIADRPGAGPIIPGDRPLRFLVASRWNSWKGHATLLTAWDRAGAPGELVIAGSPPDQGSGVDVPALIAGIRRPDTVTIAGQVTDLTALIDACDFLVVPSDAPEPFGLVAIEAFSRCRAVIGSAGGGLGQIVRHGVDGWKFDNKSVDQLTEILVGTNRVAASRLGMAGRERFEAEYAAPRFDRAFGHLWGGVEGGGRAQRRYSA